MIFHKQLVWGEEAGKHRFELTWKLSHDKFPKEGYLIVLPREESSNLLELVPCEQLKRLGKRVPDLIVVGIAQDKTEAICLAGAIIDAIYQLTGDLDIAGFYSQSVEG